MIHELAYRESDGIEIALLWNAAENRVVVQVADAKDGGCWEIAVESDRALDAFYHPYAYATS